jgi:hypothetical protein
METETKICQSCKKAFSIELDDFTFYEKIKVPPPTWCPRCRLVRRLAWQGYRILYKRKCNFTGDDVITTHHPDMPHKIYRSDIWWSDKWDPLKYGREYDFSRSFFEQFHELMKEVPLPALYAAQSTLVDSEYTNAVSDLKNCYLVFRCTGGENSAYLNVIVDAKDSIDSSYANHIELVYDSLRVNKCARVFYSQDCDECHDVWFSKDLVGCSNCIGCINLRNKQYHVFNEPYSKEAYEDFFKKLNHGSLKERDAFRKKAEEFFLKHPRRHFQGRKNQDVSGDYIYNSKNVHDSYMLRNGEDVRYSQLLKDGPVRKCYDYSIFGDNSEWIYESTWVGLTASHNKFSVWNYWSHDVEYCFGAMSSGNLFGCVGIQKGEYCILNKKYSKEEYFKTITKIKKQMMEFPYTDSMGRVYRYGEMLPIEFCPWKYNESTAFEFFPLEKEVAIAQGFAWRDSDPREYKDATVSLPDHIEDATDNLLKSVLKCDACDKNYLLIKMELDFYRAHNIPIPRKCSLCRERERLGRLNPIEIYDRTCAKCSKAIKTSYAPDRKEIVYCETCYSNEVA